MTKTVSRPPKTRKPTGKVAWPLVLVDGLTGTGKTTKALMVSLLEQVGQTWVCELGEPSADEYSLGEYDIIEHNGTYHSMMEELRCAMAQPMRDGKPNCIIFDSATALNDLLGMWIDKRARMSDKAKKILQFDPDAEIKPHTGLWNDRNNRFDDFVNMLRDWEGIAIVVCHGKEVTPFENGAPVANSEKVYKVDVRDYLLKQSSIRIHCEGQESGWKTTLQKCRQRPRVQEDGSVGWDMELPKGGLVLDHPNPVGHAIFDILKSGREWQKSSAVTPSAEDAITVTQAKQGVLKRLQNRFGADAKEVASEVWEDTVKEKLDKNAEMPVELWTELMRNVADRISNADNKPEEVVSEKAGEITPLKATA